MVSADGCQLVVDALQGKKLIDRRSTLEWPEQQNPSRADWNIWSQAFQHLVRGKILLNPIILSGQSPHPWYMDRHDSLFHFTNSGWLTYPRPPCVRPSRSGQITYSQSLASRCPAPLQTLFRASVTESGQTLKATRGILLNPTTPSQQISGILDLLSHPYYSFLYGSLSLTSHQKLQLSSSIQQGILLACCDGSYDPVTQKDTYGMVFGTPSGPILRASGPCTGHPTQQSAIRAELISINASVFLLLNVCSSLAISGGSITLYNDCTKAHKLLKNSSRKFKWLLVDDYDVILETREAIKKLSKLTNFSLLWVKSHYSGKDKAIQHCLNDDAHKMAVSALSTRHPLSDDPPPSSLVTLRCGFNITSKWQALVQERVHSDPIRDTTCKNCKWTEDSFHLVDWAALKTCLQRFSRLQLLSKCKLLHGLLHTSEQNRKLYRKSDTCPLCLSAPESFLHVVSCPHPEMKTFRQSQQETLWKSLGDLQTPPTLLEYIRYGIIRLESPDECGPPDYGSTA